MFFKKEVYAIIGAAMEVHKTLGAGFLEAVYQETFELELKERGIPYQSFFPIRIRYKGKKLKKEYIADMVCNDAIIIELKALDALCEEHMAQVINYLKATHWHLGLLINFGSTENLQWRRVVL